MKLSRTIRMIGAMLLMPLCSLAQDNYSTWMSANMEKDLCKQFSLNAELGVRTNDKARYDIGIGAEYKPIKYLKIGVGYSFIEREGPTEDHYTQDGIWNGYNKTGSWVRAHRAIADVAGTVKAWKWLRISLRERYQFTHRPEQTVDNRKVRYDILYDGNGNYMGLDELPDITDGEKIKDALNDHVLRSRLKFEVDKKGWRFSPYISGEVHNSISNSMEIEKVRAMIGTDYRISKHHSIGAAYVITFDLRDDQSSALEDTNERMHACSLNYKYSF